MFGICYIIFVLNKKSKTRLWMHWDTNRNVNIECTETKALFRFDATTTAAFFVWMMTLSVIHIIFPYLTTQSSVNKHETFVAHSSHSFTRQKTMAAYRSRHILIVWPTFRQWTSVHGRSTTAILGVTCLQGDEILCEVLQPRHMERLHQSDNSLLHSRGCGRGSIHPRSGAAGVQGSIEVESRSGCGRYRGDEAGGGGRGPCILDSAAWDISFLATSCVRSVIERIFNAGYTKY